VPEDISVVGFDDIASAAFQNPSLTTVRQPLRQMGATAARILLERLNGAEDPGEVMVKPEFVVRESTCPARAGLQQSSRQRANWQKTSGQNPLGRSDGLSARQRVKVEATSGSVSTKKR